MLQFPIPEEISTKMVPRMFKCVLSSLAYTFSSYVLSVLDLRTLQKTDGLYLFTPESYEPEAVAAVRRWFAETGRPVYTSGPLLPSASKASAHENEKKLSKESDEIQTFLDEALKTSGEKSVVYVSSPRDWAHSASAADCAPKDLLRVYPLANNGRGQAVGFL